MEDALLPGRSSSLEKMRSCIMVTILIEADWEIKKTIFMIKTLLVD